MLITRRTFGLAALVVLLFSTSGTPKEPWEDFDWGTADSTKLLFHPPRRIEIRDHEIRFYAREFTYLYREHIEQWTVTPAHNEIRPIEGWGTPGSEIRQVRTTEGPLALEAPEPGTLSMRLSSCPQPLGPVTLWTRAQLGQVWFEHMAKHWGPPPASPEEGAKRATVSDVYVADWDEDARNIWLAIRFYAGEGSLGIGTLVQIRKQNCSVRLIQPAALAWHSISRVVKAGGDLWLATEDFGEGETGPGVGLARYDLRRGEVHLLREKHPVLGSHITDLAREGNSLWIATMDGFGVLDLGTQALESWRILPRIHLAEATSVSSLPGGPTRNKIGAGKYEVRWVGAGFAEILTPDCVEGFAESIWYDTLKERNFNASSMAIATSTQWGILGLTLYGAAQESILRAHPTGWFLRVPAKPTGKRVGGWQPVSVCAGWVQLPANKIQITVSPDQ